MLDNIYIGGKTIAEQNPGQRDEWNGQRNDARREIERWSFDDLMFKMPSEKKALILADTTKEASMAGKWEQLVQLVQKSSNFDMEKIQQRLMEQGKQWEEMHV